MSNTLVVLNNNTGVDKIEMLSTEVVDLINKFRTEEGNKKVLKHKKRRLPIRLSHTAFPYHLPPCNHNKTKKASGKHQLSGGSM